MTPPEPASQNPALQPLLLAVRSLAKTVEKQLMTGMTDGTGAMAARSYRTLHQRIASLLPDDFYITAVLALEEDGEADDQTRMAQVNMLCAQLADYLGQSLKSRPTAPAGDAEEWRGVGRELQDQILQMTRKTIRRALQNVDFNIPEPPMPPSPPGVPGMPGMPPPPGTPGRKRIHIEFGTDAPPGGWGDEPDDDDDKPKNV